MLAEYRKIKKDEQVSRTIFIQELASQQAAQGNETVSNVISRINRNEELRASYKIIKTVTKPFCGATEKAVIPVENTNDKRVTTKKVEIEKDLGIQNEKKFTAAYRFIFLHEPLISQLGQDARSKYSQQIINGTYNDKKVFLEFNEAIFVKGNENSLVSTFQVREYGNVVSDVAKWHGGKQNILADECEILLSLINDLLVCDIHKPMETERLHCTLVIMTGDNIWDVEKFDDGDSCNFINQMT